MRVSTIMTSAVITIQSTATVAEAANLMLANRISGLPVVEPQGMLVGLISDSDLLRRSELDTERQRSWWLSLLARPGKVAEEYVRAHGRKVKEVMSAPVMTVSPYATLGEAADLMERSKVKRLPVVTNGQLAGIVTRSDFLKPLLREPPVEAGQPLSDAAISAAIAEELAAQSWAKNGLIRANVKNGVVTLNGSVLDERERGAAIVAAENVPGVTMVRDQLAWIDPSFGIVVQAP
ncbi:CBS domain-containing protein [Rhizobium azibense]|uniref:CBS domain-containing protein n=1 Tax=Rhizobium azibense TaxID=1136135 RepID=A0A4R3RYB2_9HYPH|nr:CBS domain-containing protein [Rhizobium azibense]TCU24436.1 CBS domain-containing protein [Rhizobium azibense]TCU39182.1 CBS domain-containing protein [Rhizobium azibense]